MKPRDFCLWLHGFTELCGNTRPSEAQWKMVVQHLDLVFNKVTPELDEQVKPTVEFPEFDWNKWREQNPPPQIGPFPLTPQPQWPPGAITC